jgi:hypothetical protein
MNGGAGTRNCHSLECAIPGSLTSDSFKPGTSKRRSFKSVYRLDSPIPKVHRKADQVVRTYKNTTDVACALVQGLHVLVARGCGRNLKALLSDRHHRVSSQRRAIPGGLQHVTLLPFRLRGKNVGGFSSRRDMHRVQVLDLDLRHSFYDVSNNSNRI